MATPGRLWGSCTSRATSTSWTSARLNFLVLDEADRMVERGHFAELHNIIDILPMPPRVSGRRAPPRRRPRRSRCSRSAGETPTRERGKRGRQGDEGGNADPDRDGDIVEGHVPEARDIARAADDDADDADGAEISLRPSQMLDRQTFVFSATLTVPDSVRRKLKRGSSREARDGKKEEGNETKGKGDKASHTLSGLMEAVPFYGRVKLVDLTDQSRTVAKGVAESALECTEVRVFFPFPFFFFFFFATRFDGRGRDASAGITPALPS